MSAITNKIDFVALVSVTHANPNGDPLNGNRPREDFNGFGEISDVCIKRKIRNRLQDMGERIFVQMDERSDDSYKSLHDRAEGCAELKAVMTGKKADKEACAAIACREWADVRAFGQVFAFKGVDVSVGVRGPVSIHPAMSLDPVETVSTQITKSVNSESTEGRASDTMGQKHRVAFGLYKIKGSVNVQLAQKTGFSEEDAENLREALRTLFENDASSARPEGSMVVERLYWWQHKSAMPATPTRAVHDSVTAKLKEGIERPTKMEDYDILFTNPEGCDVEPQIFTA